MGSPFGGPSGRQFPHLTATGHRSEIGDDPGAAYPAIRSVILILLAVDGVISALVGALMLPFYLGPVPFPISAPITGLVNAVLVWAAMQWTDSNRLAALPLLTWLVTVAVLTLGGPGGDIVFGGPGVMEYSVLLFVALGAVPPGWLLYRHSRPA